MLEFALHAQMQEFANTERAQKNETELKRNIHCVPSAGASLADLGQHRADETLEQLVQLHKTTGNGFNHGLKQQVTVLIMG